MVGDSAKSDAAAVPGTPVDRAHVQADNPFVAGLQFSTVWALSPSNTLHYAFARSAADFQHVQVESSEAYRRTSGTFNPLTDATGWDRAFRDDVQVAFDGLSAVTGIEFREASSFTDPSTTIQIVAFDNLVVGGEELHGRSTFPGRDQVGSFRDSFESFIFFNSSRVNMTTEPVVGASSNRIHTILHEFGHTLGMTHPFENGDDDEWARSTLTGPDDHVLDNDRYTVLSAERGGLDQKTGDLPYGYAVTPMALDIATLHQMYGSGHSKTGDTTYRLTDPRTNAIDLDATNNTISIGEAFYSIWDTGGTDAIIYTGRHRVVLNLNEATLDAVGDTEDVTAWIADLTARGNLSLLGPEMQVDLTDSAYHAGGFFSRVILDDGSAILGGYSIANGLYADPSHQKDAGIERAVGGMRDDILIGNMVNNLLRGRGGDDYLHGSGGDDTLSGGSGKDILNGGTGLDVLVGGKGDDLYIIDSTDDIIAERPGEGRDTVISKVSHTLNPAIERLILEGSADLSGYGSTVRNVLIGNDGGNVLRGRIGDDSLYGGDGDDVLIGGDGGDRLSGGRGTDTAYYVDATEGLTVSLVAPEKNTGLATGDTYASIENLTGTNWSDVLVGMNGNSANVIRGGGGHDVLFGLSGSDKLVGGADDDTLVGGPGSDLLWGGSGSDRFVLESASEASNIDIMPDFMPGQDVIALDRTIFEAIAQDPGPMMSQYFTSNNAGVATNATDLIVYDIDGGQLYYDIDGDGAEPSVQLLRLQTGLALSSDDFEVM